MQKNKPDEPTNKISNKFDEYYSYVHDESFNKLFFIITKNSFYAGCKYMLRKIGNSLCNDNPMETEKLLKELDNEIITYAKE